MLAQVGPLRVRVAVLLVVRGRDDVELVERQAFEVGDGGSAHRGSSAPSILQRLTQFVARGSGHVDFAPHSSSGGAARDRRIREAGVAAGSVRLRAAPRDLAARRWRARRTRSPWRTRCPGTRVGVGRLRGRQRQHPGLRNRHQRGPGRHGPVQDRHAVEQLPDRHLSPGLVRRARRAQGRDHSVDADHPAVAAGLHERRGDRPDRLRQLGRVGVVERARQRRVRDLRGEAGAPGRGIGGPGKPHRVRGPRRHRRIEDPLPDLGYDLAGVQPVRRQQPVRRRTRHQPGPRLQGQLQPAVHDPRHRGRGLGLQRRVPDGALARAQRVRRQLHDRCRHRSARRRAARAPGLPLRRPRRVLVRSTARQRRGRARRGREPRLLLRQRGVLEDPLGELVPDARHLQGDPREREDRPGRERVDRHLARPARVQSGGREARERAHRHDLHRQLLHRRHAGARGRR